MSTEASTVTGSWATSPVRPLRNHHIHVKALLYAIAAIQALPEEMQEWSDMKEMCAMARDFGRAHLWWCVFGVESHVGRTIDLWPDKDTMDDVDIAAEAEMRRLIDEAVAKFAADGLAVDAPPSGCIGWLAN